MYLLNLFFFLFLFLRSALRKQKKDADGQFDNPVAVAESFEKDLFIADMNNHRVPLFSKKNASFILIFIYIN